MGEVLAGVVGQLGKQRGRDDIGRAGRNEQGVAVRRGLGDVICADGAAGTRAIVHQHLP